MKTMILVKLAMSAVLTTGLLMPWSCRDSRNTAPKATEETKSIQTTEKPDAIMKRADSFFGIHFDLHAHENNDEIGKTLTYEMLDTFLSVVSPDFVQIDCKGHAGISSYPTKVGFRATRYYSDPMKTWREATNANNVALYVHYSGIYDRKVAEVHPEWAIMNAEGVPDKKNISVYSPYLDNILIPQLIELSDKYGVDGAWIDGECWSVIPDYRKEALEEFSGTTGIQDIPRHQDDPHYADFMQFNRKLFKRHVKKYVDAIHQQNPDFQITSNWAYSSLMPGEVDIDLDFLSGDLQATNSVYSAAFEARCLAPQGKPWDLMAWSFTWSPEKNVQRNTKSAVQLMQEASQVMAMGGGIQFYFKQNKDLSIQPWTTGIMTQLAEFCRAREEYCFRTSQIPQIGLIFSTEAYEKGLNRVYSGGWNEPLVEPLKGTLNALLDGQHSVEVLMEHHLEKNINEYPLLVWPEWNHISEKFRKKLLEYVHSGGNLLIIGPEAIQLFGEELSLNNTEVEVGQRFFSSKGRLAVAGNKSVNIEAGENMNHFGQFYSGNDFREEEAFPSCFVASLGKGKVAGICFDAGQSYYDWHHFALRDFISEIVHEVFPEPICEISGSSLLHMVLNKKDGQMQINLTNVSGVHKNRSISGYDEIPPIGPVKIQFRSDEKPTEIFTIPEKEKVLFTYKNGSVELAVPEIRINTILVINNKRR